ncbi:DUF2971 domain-containing protein [Agrobacterium tumefaciens]|uniref:DUF2971 domain-containing protein n=1 Tax=Agrobacterium tumefaciens TaxID=358 RepID=A0AA44JA35_AGRTU|nr:DUF2971 domain-containing protein [Agrobacterium tumefaciens]NTB86838.1 DUF2971 domain-containing protein [Agrobacterium tumefaciens]NTC21167.1 DUF2971 domain-containing protein [Agrobacterium tumefaciens]NTC30715.1 DUF2971 domain-containing protein [Agrobacterium tumefaciens]
MQLYYYTKLQYGLASVRDRRIKISLYDSLNDPFDFLGVAIDTTEQEAELKKIRDELSKRQGIICLSETWKEPLMWGHYANSHKGVCLGFEVGAPDYEKIDYRPARPKLSDFGKASINELTHEDRSQIALRKFNRWSYEREWRRIVDLGSQDYVDGNHYLRFDDKMVLKTILFGSKSEISTDKIEKIATAYPDVKIAITGPAKNDFDIIIDKAETEKKVPAGSRVLQLRVPDTLDLQHAMERALLSMQESMMKMATDTAGRILKSRAEAIQNKLKTGKNG